MQHITMNDLGSLPPLISIEHAGEVLRMGRSRAYVEANRAGGLIPTVSLRPRHRMVPTALLLRNLGIESNRIAGRS